MSRYSAFIIFFLLFFTLGCSAKNITYPSIKSQNNSYSPDFYYIAALDCEYRKNFACSAKMYEKLYKLTNQKKFLEDSLRNALFTNDYKLYESYIPQIEKLSKTDSEIATYLLPYYIKKKEFKKAKELVKTMLKQKKSLKNYQLLVSLYIDTQEFDKAQKVLKEYYAKHGCEPAMCSLMLFIKTLKKDVNGTIKILKELYKVTKNPAFEEEIAKILVSTKRFKELDSFVFNSKTLPKDVLLDIYASLKMYNKAQKIALKLYKSTHKAKYLAYSAIYLYEGEYLKNKTKLFEVIKRFEKSVNKADDALFYNYYGYLLIDHNIDPKKGIKYVKKALKLEPKSEYYLDSLAWGYYRLHQCKKAYKILSKLKDKDQEEIKLHIKKVKECLKR